MKPSQQKTTKLDTCPLGSVYSPSSVPAPTADYKLIPLTQGKFAIVDAENYEWLNQWKWHIKKGSKTFYAVRMNKRDGGVATRAQAS